MIDLNEHLFNTEEAIFDLTFERIAELEAEFAAAKCDEWTAHHRLLLATGDLRTLNGLPGNAPAERARVLAEEQARSGDRRAARLLASYAEAASAYEGARTALEEIRQFRTRHQER